MGLGENIRAKRKALGMTQVDLGNKLNCKRQLISDYETGVKVMSIGQLERIAKELKTSTSKLLKNGD